MKFWRPYRVFLTSFTNPAAGPMDIVAIYHEMQVDGVKKAKATDPTRQRFF